MLVAPASENSRRLEAGFDANLDFPLDDPRWAAFSKAAHCAITSYTDLDILTTAIAPAVVRFFLSAVVQLLLPARCPVSRARQRHDADHANAPRKAASSSLPRRTPPRAGTSCAASGSAISTPIARRATSRPRSCWRAKVSRSRTSSMRSRSPPGRGRSIPCSPAASTPRWSTRTSGWLSRAMPNARRYWPGWTILPTPPFIVRASLDAAVGAELKQTLLGLKPTIEAGTLYAGFAEYQDARMQRWFADLAGLPGLAHAA